MKRINLTAIALMIWIILAAQAAYSQIIWRDQLIFKTSVYQKQAQARGYVLLYADEHQKLIALDAESGEQLNAKYRLEGDEIFLNAPGDPFIKRQVLFIGRKENNRQQLGIYYFSGNTMVLTGPCFDLPAETQRILSLNYHNGYLYYLYETKKSSLILERKHIQCTAVGLPTFSNETSEMFYDYSIDRFAIEQCFTVLTDGLDCARDVVFLVCKGRNAPAKVMARIANCETLPAHTIVKLPDRNVSLTPPRGTSFPTVIVHGSRRHGYDICIIGHRSNQTRIYIRRMGENDTEIDEPEMVPVIGSPLYWRPFWIRGNWWFPIKKDDGVNMVYYSEVQGGMQLSANFFKVPELYLTPDPRDGNLLYGLATNSWRKYALGHSLSDWQCYGGFRSADFGKKTLCSLPAPVAAGKKTTGNVYQPVEIRGEPYKNSKFALQPIETLEIRENPTQVSGYHYLTTKESTLDFSVTRKYCLLYNFDYRPWAQPDSKHHYEFHLCWEASYGSDKNILGFFIPYRQVRSLIVKAVNQLYWINCASEKQSRTQRLHFTKLQVPDGIHTLPWYREDLQQIAQWEYLGQHQQNLRYLIVTKSNIYQALVDSAGNTTLIEATGITGPVKSISFCDVSPDGTTAICGGITALGRAFFAQLYLLPGKDKTLPRFSGITYQYVQNLREQHICRPRKIITWGEHIYILNFKGEIELYEKSMGSFHFGGEIRMVNEPVLDMELVHSTLCLLSGRKVYCLDLKIRSLGTSLQTHFAQNRIASSWEFTTLPQSLTRYDENFFIHFPRQLSFFKVQEGTLSAHRILIESQQVVNAGFQIAHHKNIFYIAGNKRLYKFTGNELARPGESKPWHTLNTNVCKLFCDPENQALYYLSRDGEVGALLAK